MKPQSAPSHSLGSPKEFPLKEIIERIISWALEVHSALGPGLLESVSGEAQGLTYLRAPDQIVGLLIHFNVIRLKDGVRRSIKERTYRGGTGSFLGSLKYG